MGKFLSAEIENLKIWRYGNPEIALGKMHITEPSIEKRELYKCKEDEEETMASLCLFARPTEDGGNGGRDDKL